ncbi:MAG: cytochrome C oxidase subunit IV family protein [Phycisphaerales bacterium]
MAHAHTESHNHSHADDHGHGGHGHKIVGPLILRSVLVLLLILTVLTVGQAQAELWFQGEFDFAFPAWVNIVIVMAIAGVKAAFVMAFFMQLRYDNPLNTLAMAFCYFAVVIFIGFTSMDLLTRDRVTPWKSGPVVPGGTTTPVKSARDRFQTTFFTAPVYVETRLVARQIDGYAHELAARAEFLTGDAAKDAVHASEVVAHAAADLRETMLMKRPVEGARRHAVEELEAAASKLGSSAGSLVMETSRRLASEEAPADSEAAMKADLVAMETHAHSHSHGHAHGHGHEGSDHNRSRPRSGVSGATDTAPGERHDEAHGHDAPAAAPAGGH